jgi:hypothetical protein
LSYSNRLIDYHGNVTCGSLGDLFTKETLVNSNWDFITMLVIVGAEFDYSVPVGEGIWKIIQSDYYCSALR